MRTLIKTLTILTGLLFSLSALATLQETRIGFIAYHPDQGPVLSNLIPEPENRGFSGAELGLKDNNTTGRFLQQHYTLVSALADTPEQVNQIAQQWLNDGLRILVTDLPQRQLTQLNKLAITYGAIIFNAGSYADELRTRECLSNTLHTLPSRAMLTDALGQWSNARRLKRWLLVWNRNEAEAIALADELKAQGVDAQACPPDQLESAANRADRKSVV